MFGYVAMSKSHEWNQQNTWTLKIQNLINTIDLPTFK